MIFVLHWEFHTWHVLPSTPSLLFPWTLQIYPQGMTFPFRPNKCQYSDHFWNPLKRVAPTSYGLCVVKFVLSWINRASCSSFSFILCLGIIVHVPYLSTSFPSKIKKAKPFILKSSFFPQKYTVSQLRSFCHFEIENCPLYRTGQEIAGRWKTPIRNFIHKFPKLLRIKDLLHSLINFSSKRNTLTKN